MQNKFTQTLFLFEGALMRHLGFSLGQDNCDWLEEYRQARVFFPYTREIKDEPSADRVLEKVPCKTLACHILFIFSLLVMLKASYFKTVLCIHTMSFCKNECKDDFIYLQEISQNSSYLPLLFFEPNFTVSMLVGYCYHMHVKGICLHAYIYLAT